MYQHEVSVSRGSPPRGRGKDSGTVHGCGQLRITPAWAGKRPSHCSERRRPQDHPRVSGEKVRMRMLWPVMMGSPPRGRGKDLIPNYQGGTFRITPAWAGKSIDHRDRHQQGQDHPRVGGEKAETAAGELSKKGSPPRGRGKVVEKQITTHDGGITPAWAGKSTRPWPAAAFRRDHPRVGGEKQLDDAGQPVQKGSPPRGRGKVEAEEEQAGLQGITPAWAGKSDKHRRARSWLGDHPRVGGEKTKKIP